MKRLLFLQSTSLLEAYGGIEYYLNDVLNLTVDVYGEGSAWTVVPQRRHDSALPKTRYRMSPVPFSSRRLIAKLQNRFSLAMLKEAWDIGRAFQPTLIVSGHVSLGPIAFALSGMLRVPYVTIAYGLEAWGNLFPQDEWCLRRGAGVISISHWTKKILVDRGYPGEKIGILHPGLPVAYETLPRPDRKAWGDKPFTLLSVSRLDAAEQYKGQDHVIEALARLGREKPSLRLKYLIQGDGSDRPRLEALVKAKGLESVVEFRGQAKSREEFQRVYRESDLFVMPSRFGRWDGRWRGEGFGIVYVEAAAFGVPSVAYDCGGATDIIRNGETGWLLPPDDITALTAKIAELAEAPGEVIATGLDAYDHIMAVFTRPAQRRELEQMLSLFC